MFVVSKLTMQFILCGLLGLLAEVIFTALTDIFTNRRIILKSSTSLWMFPIYGLLPFIYPPLHDYIQGYDWYIRGAIYMVAFYIVQYVSGWILLKVTRDHVWEYKSKFNLHGHIDLPHAPVWFFAGLGFEHLYPYIVRLSKILT